MHLIPHQATDTVKDGVRGVYLLSFSICHGFCCARRTWPLMRTHLPRKGQGILTSNTSQPVPLGVKVPLVRRDDQIHATKGQTGKSWVKGLGIDCFASDVSKSH